MRDDHLLYEFGSGIAEKVNRHYRHSVPSRALASLNHIIREWTATNNPPCQTILHDLRRLSLYRYAIRSLIAENADLRGRLEMVEQNHALDAQVLGVATPAVGKAFPDHMAEQAAKRRRGES